ncbi:MFS transporter [Sporobolomyces koalae]|uniref:MFS transporter n=1 Tax=Sporobolomyces koalae TaxID=500713 RepID=UPI003177F0C0
MNSLAVSDQVEDHKADAGTDEVKDEGVKWVEWDGEDDPENPFNWSNPRKWRISSVAFLFTCLVSFSTSAYTITAQSIQEELHTSATLTFVALSTFNLAFGAAPLILAPLSELYGRSSILFVSTLGFAIFLIPQALAPNIATLIVIRFFYGCFGSTGVALGGGILAEVWSDEERGLSMALFSLSATAPTGLGSVAFGYLAQVKGFRYVNWVLFALAGLLAVATFFLLDETRASVLLERRAKRLRQTTGDERYISKAEADRMSLVQVWKTNMHRPVSLLFHEPVLIAFTTWIGFTWGVMYLELVSVPLTYKRVYSFNLGESGLIYITQILGSLLGFALEFYCSSLYRRNVVKRGSEARLYTAFFGGVFFPIGCWIYAMTAYPQIHFIVPAIGLTILYTGLYLVFVATYGYLADAYSLYASSALAAMGFCRNVTGAVFPLFTPQMYDRLGIQGAGALTAGIATLLSLTPFLLFRYGARLRARSSFAQTLASGKVNRKEAEGKVVP